MNWTSQISIVISVLGLTLLTPHSAGTHGSTRAGPLAAVCQCRGLELPRKCKHRFLFHFIPGSDIVYPAIKESLNCSRNRPETSDVISWSLIMVSPRLSGINGQNWEYILVYDIAYTLVIDQKSNFKVSLWFVLYILPNHVYFIKLTSMWHSTENIGLCIASCCWLQ